MALGPARLVATIETEKIVSKSAVAAYAAARWPEHTELLHRADVSRSGASAVGDLSRHEMPAKL